MAEDLDIKNKIMWERDIFSETKKNDDDIMLDLDDISNKRSFNKKDFIDTVIKNYEKLQNITIFVGDESCNCGLDFKRN